MDLHCPDALRILDFAHAAQRLAEIGQTVWGEESEQPQQWTQQQCHALKHDGARSVLADVLRLQAADPGNAVVTTNLTYLTKRVGQVQYPAFAAQGWPIGSGMVDSANKLVVEARLKGSGMHWAAATSTRCWRCATWCGVIAGPRGGNRCRRGGAHRSGPGARPASSARGR